MITGEYWKLYDDKALQEFDRAAVRLLEKSGCRVEHEGLLALLEGGGCRVSRSDRRCYIPERLVREAVAKLGGKTTEAVKIPTGWNPQHHLWPGGSYPHLLEWPSGRRRLATRTDVADITRLAHVLPEFQGTGKVLTCCEVDQRIEPLWAVCVQARITDKPIGGGEIFYPEYIEPLVRMGEVLGARPEDAPLVASCDFFIAPLIFDGKQAACFLEKRRFGIRNVPGTMPISGLSAPVTPAGTVVVALAELLAGWVFGYVVNPAIPAGGIVSSGSLDMRTASACFGSPEAMLQDAMVVQACRRLYGIQIGAATGYVDCKRPGLEAVFQKMLPLVGAPFGTGLQAGGGGLLSAGQDYSPVQHLLDADIGAAVGRFWGTCEVNADTLAVDEIEGMMKQERTNFAETDHTLQHFRGEQWYPRWLDRTLWQGEATERDAELRMLERIDRHCREAIARYTPPAIDPARVTELERIFRAAERKILGGNSTPL